MNACPPCASLPESDYLGFWLQALRDSPVGELTLILNSRVSVRCPCTQALVATDPDPAAVDAAGHVFCLSTSAMRVRNARDVQRCVEQGWRGSEAQSVLTRQPEYTLLYLFWLLAHDPEARNRPGKSSELPLPRSPPRLLLLTLLLPRC